MGRPFRDQLLEKLFIAYLDELSKTDGAFARIIFVGVVVLAMVLLVLLIGVAILLWFAGEFHP